MPVLYPYGEENPVKIQLGSDYYPRAIELLDSVTEVKPVAVGPDGVTTMLDRDQVLSLAGVFVGLRATIVRHRLLGIQSRKHGPVEAMRDVFDAQKDAVAVAAAYSQGVLRPVARTWLGAIPQERHRERFIQLGVALGKPASPSEIAHQFHYRSTAMLTSKLRKFTALLGLDFLEEPAPPIVGLVAGALALTQTGEAPLNPEQWSKLFAEPAEIGSTRIIPLDVASSAARPSNQRPAPPATLYFGGQPRYLRQPHLRAGYPVRLEVGQAKFTIHNRVFATPGEKGSETRLSPYEMSTFLLRCILDVKEVNQLAAKLAPPTEDAPLRSAYQRFLGSGPHRPQRVLNMFLDRAIEIGLVEPVAPPDLQHLTPHWRRSLHEIMPLVGKGLSYADMDRQLKSDPKEGSTHYRLTRLRNLTGLDTAGLQLFAAADRIKR